MRKLVTAFAAAAVAVGVLVIGAAAATTTIVVTSSAMSGWQIIPDGTVPYSFAAGPAAIGSGSLQFGPIDGTVGANKFVMFSPYSGPVADLTSFSYDFFIDSASPGGASDAAHFYANVYVDDTSNGIGFFGPGPGSTGFYDCRYDSVPTTGVVSGWTTNSFGQASTWTNIANRTGTCPATLAGLTAGSLVRFIAVNGGQSTSSDAGLKGGYDKVVISTTTGVTTYDFEQICLTSTTGTTITLLADCTTDETILVPNGFTLDGNGFTITGVDPVGEHFLGAVVQGEAGTSSVTVENLEVTTSGLTNVCDAGVDRLRGILFDGVGGTIRNNTVTHIQQGPSGSGCQEGNAIEVRNAPFDATGVDKVVVIEGNAADDYIKNGITANGSVAATIAGNTVTGNGPVGVPLAAQNGIQIGFGGTATIRQNVVRDHNYTPASFVACGLLYFEADGVRASKSTFSGNERDVCNFGRGGGQYNPAP